MSEFPIFELFFLGSKGVGGKRGIRVYPSWDIAINKQAQQTQKWQLEYFLEIPKNSDVNIACAKILYRV